MAGIFISHKLKKKCILLKLLQQYMIDKPSDQTVINIIFYFNYNMFIVQEYF